MVVDDISLENRNVCLASYFLDTFKHKCYLRFGDTYWPANVSSCSFIGTIPETENTADMFQSTRTLNLVLANCSALIVKGNSREVV